LISLFNSRLIKVGVTSLGFNPKVSFLSSSPAGVIQSAIHSFITSCLSFSLRKHRRHWAWVLVVAAVPPEVPDPHQADHPLPPAVAVAGVAVAVACPRPPDPG
jgi:hypothetical protein